MFTSVTTIGDDIDRDTIDQFCHEQLGQVTPVYHQHVSEVSLHAYFDYLEFTHGHGENHEFSLQCLLPYIDSELQQINAGDLTTIILIDAASWIRLSGERLDSSKFRRPLRHIKAVRTFHKDDKGKPVFHVVGR